ncbi:carbon-nitrogen hydrolase family protein [Nonomuraea sp. NPDC000554]|uniref:carbon-nitrogen hydrolase family protein n=1 Tax=Nonomuraea sp. NPDC000554 TaxID=3154259 RepID=UPI0033182F56
MLVRTAVAQTRVTWDVQRNLAVIRQVIRDAAGADLVVFPEGALSGYGSDLGPLAALDLAELAEAEAAVAAEAARAGVHVVCGCLRPVAGGWSNAALVFAPDGTRRAYDKVNLAMNERGVLVAGTALPVYDLKLSAGEVRIGVQICREIRFAEQWHQLARSGTRMFVYVTNAANPAEPPGVWRSHLISRAAENQRWLVAANLADPAAHCPTMVVSPRGEVVAEAPAGEPAVLRAELDMGAVSDWYLSQRRVVQVRHAGEAT